MAGLRCTNRWQAGGPGSPASRQRQKAVTVNASGDDEGSGGSNQFDIDVGDAAGDSNGNMFAGVRAPPRSEPLT